MPFHHLFCWKNGFFEPLDPTQTVCSDGNVIHWKPVVPAHPPNSCPNCSESKFTTLSSNNLCIFVTLSGRYDLYTPIFRCKCGYVDEELGKAMHQSGFYSTGRNSSTFYNINLLDSWHFLKRSSPGTSLQALVSALELFGASRGRHYISATDAAPRHPTVVGIPPILDESKLETCLDTPLEASARP
nr:uncharacterized protein LOC123766623 [Procambarus clarkii]